MALECGSLVQSPPRDSWTISPLGITPRLSPFPYRAETKVTNQEHQPAYRDPRITCANAIASGVIWSREPALPLAAALSGKRL